MKYVAFLDVLGFKQLLKGYKQYEAEHFIGSLSSLLYRIWDEKHAQESKNINGYIVSDSIIENGVDIGKGTVIYVGTFDLHCSRICVRIVSNRLYLRKNQTY